MEDVPATSREATEKYLVETYCVSRPHAQRLLRKYGRRKAEIDHLLGARGRTRQHRAQDIERSTTQVSFE